MSTLRNVLMRILLDGLCLFFVFLPWIVLQAVNTPYRRGFYCDDSSIKYPFKDNTVSNAVLTACGFVIAFLIITICEVVRHYCPATNQNLPLQLTQTLSVPYFIVLIYKYFGIFLFGLAAQQTLTNIGKYSIGRLRPHFLDVCFQGQFNRLNCTYPGRDNIFVFVEDYKCVDEGTPKAVDSRLSFPSGHSSFSVYVAIFLSLYMQSRFTWKGSKLSRPLIQALLIYGAFYVCLSRVSDFKHHPTDVLSGAILGFFVAALVGVHVADFFSIKAIFTRLGYYPASPIKENAGPNVSINMADSEEPSYRDKSRSKEVADHPPSDRLFYTKQSRV